MPFISIQSIFKKIATIITDITEMIVTNLTYDVDNSSLGLGLPSISGDGLWMSVACGGIDAGYTDLPAVTVYKRSGPGAPWQFVQELTVPELTSDYLRNAASWGYYGAPITKDGNRIAVHYYSYADSDPAQKEGAPKIAVFSRSGDVWSLEQIINESSKLRFFEKPATFNTGTGVDTALDTITTDDINEFIWETTVAYRKNGGSVDVGLAESETSPAIDHAYWVKPIGAERYFNSSSLFFSTILGQTEADFNGIGLNGTFNGGSGHSVGDFITLISSRAVIRVDSAPLGVVTAFTIVTRSTTTGVTQATYNQSSTTGTGINFSLTIGGNNLERNLISYAHPFVTGDPVRFCAWGLEETTRADVYLENLNYYKDIYYVRAHNSTYISLHPTALDATNDTNRIDLSIFNYISAISQSNQGTGYQVGDVLTIAGGDYLYPGVIAVRGVGITGNITSYALLNPNGRYRLTPTISGLPPTYLAAQTQTSYNNSPTTEGTFFGGSGYTINDVLTMSDGSTVTVNTVSSGVVTAFTVTPANTTPVLSNTVLTSTGGTGTGFTLTPESGNFHYLVTGGSGTGAAFFLTFTNSWTAFGQPRWLSHAKKFKLYPSQADADSEINAINLTSSGNETHELGITMDNSSGSFYPGAAIAINSDGSRIISTIAMLRYATWPSIVIYDRVGTTWSESTTIELYTPNTLDWSDPSWWEPQRNKHTPITWGSIAISGDGNTVTSGSMPMFWILNGFAYLSNISNAFNFVASNPLYSNKPTIELLPGSGFTFDTMVRPGQVFMFYDYGLADYRGRFIIDTVESPTLITISPESETTFPDATAYYTTLVFDDRFQMVYRYNGTSWEEEAALFPPDTPMTSDSYAETMAALSYDGNVLVNADWTHAYDDGRVYVYERTGTTWSFLQTLNPDSEWMQRFGIALAMSADGNSVAVGAPWYGPYIASSDTPEHMTNPEGLIDLWPRPPYTQSSSDYNYAGGKIYLFKRANNGDLFTQYDSYYPFSEMYTFFGEGIDLTDDGNTVVAGAPESEGLEGLGMFDFSGVITTWEQLTYTPAPTITRNYANYLMPPEGLLPADLSSQYGTKHKMSNDGSTLIVCYEGSASIDVYKSFYNGSDLIWTLNTTLVPSTLLTTIRSIDINATGTKIVASCAILGGDAIVTFRDESGWIESVYNNPTEPVVRNFGTQLAMSSDGSTLCIQGTATKPIYTFNTGTGINSSTEVITFSTEHDFIDNTPVIYTRQGGVVNTGATNGTLYWVRRVSSTQITLHSSLSNALNNVKLNLTASGSETHGVYRQANTDYVYMFAWNGSNNWTLVDTDVAVYETTTRDFGRTLDINSDGTRVVVSSDAQIISYNQNSPNTTGTRYLSLYEFEKRNSPTFVPEWITIVNGGTGYTLNDILTLSSGTPTGAPMTIRVTGESGGVITSAVIEDANTYTNVLNALGTSTVTGGTGSNASFIVWWNGARYVVDTDQPITIASAGSGYKYDSPITRNLALVGGTPEYFAQEVEVTSVDGSGAVLGMRYYRYNTGEFIYTSIPNPNAPVEIDEGYQDGSGCTINISWKPDTKQYSPVGFGWFPRGTKTRVFWEPGNNTTTNSVSKINVALSDDDSVLAVSNDTTNFIYVYEKENYTSNVRHFRKILLSDTPNVDVGLGDLRGLAVSGDGNVIVAGAWKKTVGADTNAGGLFVFRKTNTFIWRQEQYIPCPCPAANGQFGASVSINNDGSIITVAAPAQSTIYTFTTASPSIGPGCPVPATGPTDSYTLQATINPTQSVTQQRIGSDVATDATGNRMVVGGAETRVFVRFGDEWILEQELIPTEYLAFQDRVDFGYGHSVDINADGSVVVVGQPSAENTYSGVGRAYVFTRTGSTWAQTATFNPIGFDGGDVRFGIDVSINPAGNVITVSADDRFAWGLDGRCAQAHVFRNVAGTWNGIRVNPVAIDANYLSGSIDYVDNGTNKGIMVVGVRTSEGFDTVTKFFFYEHVYGTPDTLTLTYTYISDPGDWQGTKKGLLQFSPDKGKYLIAGDPNYDPANTYETVGRVLIFKNTSTIGSDTDPAGPWSVVSQITPPNIGRLPITLANSFIYPWIEFGVAVKISTNGERVLISSSNFTYPDVVSDYNCQLFWGGSAWVFEKGIGESWAPVPDRRLFPRNSNGEFLGGSDDQVDHTTGAIDCTDDMNIIILGGARYMQSTMVSADPDLTWVGQARIYVHTPASTKPLRTYTDVAMLQDYDLSLEGNYYGEGTQALSNDGNTIAVTYAYGNSFDIDIYVKVAGVWTWQDTLTAANISPGTGGIQRIKISDDGNKIVCSHDAGEFTTFTRSAGVWTEQALLIVTGGIGSNVYSYDYALSGDGNNLFITIYDYAGLPAPTIVKVHTWNAGTWVVQDDTSISGAAVLDENYGGSAMDFGNGLACSYDGNWLVATGVRYVKAVDGFGWYESPCGYVFHRIGTTWSLHSITPAFWYSQGTNNVRNQEGRAAMTPEGTRFVIANAALNRTWVFSRDLTTDRHWKLDAILTYEDPAYAADEGNSSQGYYWGVDIANDGKQVISAQYNAFPYSRMILWTNTDDVWRTEQVFVNPVDPLFGSYFSYALCISGDGSTITASDNYNVDADGVLWVFERELEADEMQPFPFSTYALDDTDVNLYTNHYYDDPTLDAVQLNVRIAGDGWEDTTHDVFLGFGLMNGTVTPELVGMTYNSVTDTVYDLGAALVVSGPQIPLYQASTYPSINSEGLPQPQPQGTYEFPGVASTSVLYSWNSYLQVPCYGKPVSYEQWYSENPAKTNPNVKFSGYTHFGDFNSGHPEMYPEVTGYVRRMVYGILKKDTDMSTCSTGDIVAGIIFNGTDSYGEAHVVVNGLIKATLSSSVLVYGINCYFDPFMADTVANFGNLSQVFDYLEVTLFDANYNMIGFTGFLGGAGSPTPDTVTPIDTYNVKFGWYYDFVPDAGIGTYCGLVFANAPTLFTHPGWPV